MRFKWNEKQLTEADFFRLCRRFKITIVEMPLTTHGFYYCVKGKHYIAIDSRLNGIERLFVLWHEFAHFLMHVPDRNVTANFYGVGCQTRNEKEADIFALCALIPKHWVKTKTLRELVEDEGFSEEFVWNRKKFYDEYEIKQENCYGNDFMS